MGFYASLPGVDYDYEKCARYCQDKEGCVGFDVCMVCGGDCQLFIDDSV